MSACEIVSFADAHDRYSRTIVAGLRHGFAVGSISELEATLASLRPARTIDLVGHTSSPDRLLRLGSDLIDTRSPRIESAFARIAEQLIRVGAGRLRLLGCGTAVTVAARRTIKDIARIVGPVEVFGTVDMVSSLHFDKRGLRKRYESRLIVSSDL